MKSQNGMRIGVVAADPLRSLGLEAILNEIAGLEAVPLTLEQFSGKEAREQKLAAAVLDARSAGPALLDILARMRREYPSMKLVVLGESLDPHRIQKAIGAGAKGFLTETAGEAEIRMAMEVVLDGSVWAPRKVLARLLEAGGITGSGAAQQSEAGQPIAGKMTPREMQVLELLKDGSTNRDIGKAMGIDETTVKAHLGRMLRKTGASNRVELTLRAMADSK
jgi:DNA-binding NarL/FixJ family response regulator